MQKTFIAIVVLILVAGGLYFALGNKAGEAPALENDSTLVGGEMPFVSEENLDGGIAEDEATQSEEVAVKEFTVTGKNFSFSPATIKVKKGDKVKITFENSEGFHDFVIDEFGAATKQFKAPGTEVLEFTADKAGSFEYYCSVGSHRAMGMKGTLVVE